MEGPRRRGPTISMFFALGCFLLPFLTISCPGGRVSLTGIEVAVGSTIRQKDMLGNAKENKFPAQGLGTAALVLTVGGALLSLAAGPGPRIATGAIGAVNFILLLLLKSKLDLEATVQGGGMLRISWGLGYWLSLLGYAATMAIVLLVARAPAPRELPTPVLPPTEPGPQPNGLAG